MRISDWSSDVCSSDLRFPDGALWSELADRNALDEEALQKLADALVDFHSRAQIAWPGDGAVRIGKIIAGNAEAMALYPDILDPMAVEDLNRSEEHTSELQSLMRISYAVFCLKKKKRQNNKTKPK